MEDAGKALPPQESRKPPDFVFVEDRPAQYMQDAGVTHSGVEKQVFKTAILEKSRNAN